MEQEDDVNPEQRRIVNETLLTAVTNWDSDLINLCLQKGADINMRGGTDRTPLMMAVWKDNPSLIRFILSKGPELFLKDADGKTAYDLIKNVSDTQQRKTITLIMLQALPDAPPIHDPSTEEVIALAEQKAMEPRENRAAPHTASFGHKEQAQPPLKHKSGFSI